VATNRLEILKQMVSSNPKNTFARYGLAMEYSNNGNYEEAISEYRTLLSQDENYAAAYFHGGQALEKLGDVDGAREMYQRGIHVTTSKGDAHTRAELEAVLAMLPV
jgi:tetratricopeptide (TPR) repeat protein